jgi:hypothetical protein
MAEKSKRTCAYCGEDRWNRPCRCKYRFKRKRLDGLNHGFSVECCNLSAQTNLAEMLESIKDSLPVSIENPEKAIGVWRWSFDCAKGK